MHTKLTLLFAPRAHTLIRGMVASSAPQAPQGWYPVLRFVGRLLLYPGVRVATSDTPTSAALILRYSSAEVGAISVHNLL